MLLPIPWLRGLDDRLRVVIDWRDPAVARVFVLMLPVTIGLVLINFNLVVNTLFASRFIDPTRARARLMPLSASTCSHRECSRWPSRRSSSAPLPARHAEDLDGFRHTVALGCGTSRSRSSPRACSVPSSQCPSPASSTSAALGVTRDDRHGECPRRVFARPHVQRGDADAEPRPSASRRRGSPGSPRKSVVNTALAAALYRVGIWGIPLATSLANIAGTAARSSSSAGDWAASSSARPRERRPRHDRLGRARDRRLPGLVPPRRRAGPFAWRATRIARNCSVTGFGAYLISCRLLGVRELDALLSLLGRFRRG